MSKAGNSLGLRIAALEASRVKAKKLRGKAVSFEPMQELIGVSRQVLRTWCREIPGFEASGAFITGGNGVAWEFKPLPTIDYLLKHFRAERDAKMADARRVRDAIGGKALAAVPEEMGLDEIAKMIRVARELREERQRQGSLVEIGTIRTAVDGMISRMQQAALQAAREQDPTGQWPPHIAVAFEEAVNSVILRMGEAGERFLREFSGSTA